MNRIILSIENPLFLSYLEDGFAGGNFIVVMTDEGNLAETIAENPSGVLLLQSDKGEYSLIELARKLKRIFPEDIKTILFSSDYRMENEAGPAVDRFLPFPMPIDEIRAIIKGMLEDKKRILIIDDSRLVHNHLTPPLENEGYEITGAYNGREGLDSAKQMKPDLIICDIEMPEMNGFEVCAEVRRVPDLKDVYIIMSSTLSSTADQQKGFRAGVDEYIIKPVVIPELLDRIRKVFRSNLAGRENVLVLEQDTKTAGAISKSLAKQGFAARLAYDIKSALKIMERMQYELLISGMDLSDGNAVDLMMSLKRLPENKQPAVLILTSRESPSDVKMVMNVGAHGILSKPFSMDSLLVAVERTLADRRIRLEKAQLEKYVSRASLGMALEKSILSGKGFSVRADRRLATIFFSDIEGFTPRCERYAPKEIVSQINLLFDVMTRIIMENKGDIDKFIGDACMAFWLDNDPAVSAKRAVASALAMRNALADLNANHPILMNDPIRIRIGINTGEIILCDLGSSESRMDLTAIGDPVNLASRLESASKHYGVDNLVSEYTMNGLWDEFGVRIIDFVKVKGKKEPVTCYEMFNRKSRLSKDEERLISLFNEAVQSYRKGDFENALAIFETSEKLEKTIEDGKPNPSSVYMERCRKLIENRPSDWDGIWTLDVK